MVRSPQLSYTLPCIVVFPKFDHLSHYAAQAARPVAPLPAGSIVAWCGNVIHWGSRCSPNLPPRVSIGLNFLRAGEKLQSSIPNLSRADAPSLTAVWPG